MPDYSIPMSMAPAQVDPRIPMQGDTRLPLAVENFKPVDSVANTAKAYSLADAAGTLQDKEIARQDTANDKMIVQMGLQSGLNLDTPEGVEEAAKAWKGKVSPATYEKLVSLGDQKKLQKAKLQEAVAGMSKSEFDLKVTQQEEALKMLQGPLDTYKKVLEETKDQAKATEAFNSAKTATLQMVSQEKDASGKPLYPPERLKQFETATPDQIESRIKSSKYWLDTAVKASTIALHQSQAKAADARADAINNPKPNKLTSTMEEINDGEADGTYTPEQAKAMREKLTNLGGGAAKDVKPTLTPEAITSLAKRVAAGDKTALQNIGRGAQGAANLTAVNNALAELNLDPKAVMKGRETVAAAGAGMRSAAQRAAKIDAAAIEVDKFADNALTSLAKVTRGNLVPLNSILSKAKLGTGSAEEAEFATYVQSLVGAYASVIGRGTPTVHSQEEAAKIIRKDYSPEQFRAMVAALKIEARAVVDASKAAGDNISEHTFGKDSKVEPTQQKNRDGDARTIQQEELEKTEAELPAAEAAIVAATTPAAKTKATAARDRLLSDIAGIKRELGKSSTAKPLANGAKKAVSWGDLK